MIKQWKRLISLALTPLLLLALFAMPGSASEAARDIAGGAESGELLAEDAIEVLQEEIRNLRAEQSNIDDQLALCQGKIDGVALEKKLLDEQVFLYFREVCCFDELLSIYDELLQAEEQKYSELDTTIQSRNEILTMRLRQAHEEGLPGILELMSASEDLLSLLISLERQNQLEKYDDELMSELNDMQGERVVLRTGIDRLRGERHQIATEQVERTRVFHTKLQESGSYLWNLQSDVHRFSYFIQQSQAGVQIAHSAIQAEVNAFVATLDAQGLAAMAEKRNEKLALLSDYMKGQMVEGVLQQGGEFFLSGSKYILPLMLNTERQPTISSTMGHCTYQIGEQVVGDYHSGIDISATYGTSVVASASGRVISTGWQNGYGNYVVLWHEDGSQTRYAHLSEITVEAGDYLLQGEILGAAGSTGNSKGVGCHFELLIDGQWTDPTAVLTFPD